MGDMLTHAFLDARRGLAFPTRRAALVACADAGKFDLAAARAWWTDRGATIRARSKAKRAAAHGATMAINLRGRGAGDHG
jgi:hypothetical protein